MCQIVCHSSARFHLVTIAPNPVITNKTESHRTWMRPIIENVLGNYIRVWCSHRLLLCGASPCGEILCSEKKKEKNRYQSRQVLQMLRKYDWRHFMTFVVIDNCFGRWCHWHIVTDVDSFNDKRTSTNLYSNFRSQLTIWCICHVSCVISGIRNSDCIACHGIVVSFSFPKKKQQRTSINDRDNAIFGMHLPTAMENCTYLNLG